MDAPEAEADVQDMNRHRRARAVAIVKLPWLPLPAAAGLILRMSLHECILCSCTRLRICESTKAPCKALGTHQLSSTSPQIPLFILSICICDSKKIFDRAHVWIDSGCGYSWHGFQLQPNMKGCEPECMIFMLERETPQEKICRTIRSGRMKL